MKGEGPLTMLIPVGVLTVLAAIGGFIQFAPYWEPITTWLALRATLPIAEPGAGRSSSHGACLTPGSRASARPGPSTAPPREVPSFPSLQRVVEHKFYFDELYDAVFYRPAAAFATRLRRDFEEPVVLASGPDLGETAFDAGRLVRRLQTGLLRTYVLFLGMGTAILAVVFLTVR
jgi:NADH-quinone oxidoreductase subunit L